MNVNKNGIRVQTPKKSKRRQPLEMALETRRFRLIDDESHVEVVLPVLSPIIQVCLKDGWEEMV